MATLAKNKTIKVEISKDPKAPNGIGFALNEGNGPTDTIEFKNDNHPGFMVYFKIRDVGQTGLLFQPSPLDALWVKKGTTNPPSGSEWPGFVPLSVENNRKKLIVYCRNEKVEKFKFTLRFVGPGGQAIDYDPIGDGLNGPRGAF